MSNHSESFQTVSELHPKIFFIKTEESLKDKSPEITNAPEVESKADFETAIGATGFGLFNIILFCCIILSGITSIFDTTALSYVVPVAQCDLNLSLVDKGSLIAVPYAGMITSALVWGFLSDVLGRKKLLVYGLLADFACNAGVALSNNFWMLATFKFMSGFIINGPFAVLMSYVSEFHSAKYRAIIMQFMGLSFSIANLVLPLLSWWILPQKTYAVFGTMIRSWKVLLGIAALPSLLAGICYSFLPESPKFLMTTGKNDKALKVFKRIYKTNTRKDSSTYGVKHLINELDLHKDLKHGGKVTANRNTKTALKEGLQQIKPLLHPPYISKMTLISLINFGCLLGCNTMRLWLPQMFTTIVEYEQHNTNHNSDLCTMLEYEAEKNVTSFTNECIEAESNYQVYIPSIVVALSSFCGYILTGTIVNFIGKKRLIVSIFCIIGSASFSLYWAKDANTTLALLALFVSLSGIAGTALLSVQVDYFPTTTRTMSVAVLMMSGRTGSLIGIQCFSVFLQMGCAYPFFTIAAIQFLIALMSFLLPNTDMKPLE